MTKTLIDFKTMDDVLTGLRNRQNNVSVGDKTVLRVKNVKIRDVEDLSKCQKSLEAKRAKELKKMKTKINNERLEKSRQKQKAVQEKIETVRNAELIKQIKLVKRIKEKDIRTKAFHSVKEQTRRYVRQKNDVERYNKKVETQIFEMGKNQLITKECIAKTNTSKDNIGLGDKSQRIDDKNRLDETVDAEVVDEDCVIDSKQSTIETLYQRKSFAPFREYLDRITMIKKNFHSCEAGRYFLEKTEPLWDSLTNCVYRKSEILREMTDCPASVVPEAYKNYYDQIAIRDVKSKHSRSLRKLSFLSNLINGLNYELTDEEIIDAVKKAKNMVGRHSTAGEIIAMTNVILEYEIDVKSNVIYVLDGLCGRAVFEYGKKKLRDLLLRRATKMVKRLQHLNKINLIPTELLVAKKTEQQVEPIVLDLMTNDEKFGYLDLPDDSTSDAWSKSRAKMMQFAEQLNKKKKCPNGNENDEQLPSVYKFDGVDHINKHSKAAIDKLFNIVYKRLAADLAGTTSSPVSKAQKSELQIIRVQKQIAEQRKHDTRCKEMCNMRRRAARVSLFKRMHMEAAEAEIEANINKAKEEQSRRLAELDQEQKLAETMAELKRKEIVQNKTEQWAQENCHELRHTEKQLRTAYAKKELMAQIKEKEAAKKEAKVRDYYDDLKMIEANEKEKLAEEKTREKQLEERAMYKKVITKQRREAINKKNPRLNVQPYCPINFGPLEKSNSKDKLVKMSRLKQDMAECVRIKMEIKQNERKQADLMEKYVSDFLEHKERETTELDDAKRRKQDEYDKVYEYLVNNLISLMSDKSEKLDMKLILEEEQQKINEWLKVKEDERLKNIRRDELIKQNDAQLTLKEEKKREQKRKDLEEAEKMYREDDKVEEVKHDDKHNANTEYGKELKRLVEEKENEKKEAWKKMKNEAREAAELEAKRMADIENRRKIIMQQHETTLAGFFPPNLSTKNLY